MLSAIARLYAVIMRLRNTAYDSGVFHRHGISVPVLSVGNITAGGTGKTPVVEFLLAYCLQQGLHPAVVTRGYRRRSRGLVVVSDGRGVRVSAEQSGDEAAQIARKFPAAVVIADAKRVRGARHAVSAFDADVILLDDAFQHRAITRDCDIVVIDARQDMEAQRMIPAGRLREPLDHLRRADIVLLSRCVSADACAETTAMLRRWTRAPVYGTFFRPVTLRRLSPGSTDLVARRAPATPAEAKSRDVSSAIGGQEAQDALPPGALAGRRVTAFCGIGSPESFRRLLTDLGMEIDAFHSMGDHHWFTPREMRRLVRDALQRTGGLLLTTEKDAVRLAEQPWMKELLDELSGKATGEVTGDRSAEEAAGALKAPARGIYIPVLQLQFLEREDDFFSEMRRVLP